MGTPKLIRQQTIDVLQPQQVFQVSKKCLHFTMEVSGQRLKPKDYTLDGSFIRLLKPVKGSVHYNDWWARLWTGFKMPEKVVTTVRVVIREYGDS